MLLSMKYIHVPQRGVLVVVCLMKELLSQFSLPVTPIFCLLSFLTSSALCFIHRRIIILLTSLTIYTFVRYTGRYKIGTRREISGCHDGEYEHDCLWDIAPCRLVETDRRFRGALMMKVVRTLKCWSIFTRLHGAISQRQSSS
jgi:hypothetical protein